MEKLLKYVMQDCNHPKVPKTYRQLAAAVEQRHGATYVLYDACPGKSPEKPCHFLYRCDYKDARDCPLCKTSRHDAEGKPRLQMIYNPLESYMNYLYSDPDLARFPAPFRCSCFTRLFE